jgi:hypothetical protein
LSVVFVSQCQYLNMFWYPGVLGHLGRAGADFSL